MHMTHPGPPSERQRPRVKPPSVVGLLVAALAWMVGWLPSLLPGGPLIEGVTLGIVTVLGYAFGAAVGASVATLWHRRAPPRWLRVTAWLAIVLAVISGVGLSAGVAAQADQMNSPQLAAGWLVTSLIGASVAIALLAAGRGIRHLTGTIARRLTDVMPDRPGAVAYALAVSGVVVGVVLTVGLSFVGTQAAFNRIDASTSDQSPPAVATRSGSSESLISWNSLGRQGRDFVSQGTNSATIRSFAGLKSGATPEQRAQLAVADMLRAGGASADVWIGITTTGNGFVDPVAAQAAETVANNRSALVAIQYSTLPSWLSFLVNQEAAREAGIATYNALVAARETLPVEQRPALVLYGESLGAFGSPAPFAGMSPEDVADRIDGALWVGPPSATDPVTRWTDSGTPPAWQPVVDDGVTARYAASAPAVADPPGGNSWPTPRILVLQNPTDPVVWFAPALVWQKPSWLRGQLGPGVQEDTRWTPVLFFFQVALDLPPAVGMPSGYGHNYSDALLAAWQQVLPPQ